MMGAGRICGGSPRRYHPVGIVFLFSFNSVILQAWARFMVEFGSMHHDSTVHRRTHNNPTRPPHTLSLFPPLNILPSTTFPDPIYIYMLAERLKSTPPSSTYLAFEIHTPGAAYFPCSPSPKALLAWLPLPMVAHNHRACGVRSRDTVLSVSFSSFHFPAR